MMKYAETGALRHNKAIQKDKHLRKRKEDGTMRKGIEFVGVLMALVAMSLALAGCNNGSSGSDEPALPEGALTGVFSVSATERVHFSKGNLWYDGSSTWGFEANQYDTTPPAGGTWVSSHVSHFYWSKEASVAYAESYSDSGAVDDDVLFTNATETTPKADFTVNGVTGKYRALSRTEWEWLLGPYSSPNPGTNCRESSTVNGTDNARYAEVIVNGVKGLLIFPDTFTWNATTMGNTPTTINTYCSGFGAGTYDTAQFAAMEAAGCVFLPAAGGRYGSDAVEVGDYGYYWSATASGAYYAYYLDFNDSYVGPAYYNGRSDGQSVRLVCGEN